MKKKNVSELVLAFFISVVMCLVTIGQIAEATTALADVGMVTMLSGKVKYAVGGKGKEVPVKSFMKIRTSDRLILAEGTSMQLVIFANGRKENWKGPMVITVSNNGTVAEGSSAAPVVQEMSGQVTNEMRQVADLLETSRLQRSGAIMVRGVKVKKEAPLEDMELTSDQKMIVDDARARYRDLLEKTGENDITADLYLFSVLADYDQFTEMNGLLAAMRKKQPANEDIDLLEEWLKDQVN